MNKNFKSVSILVILMLSILLLNSCNIFEKNQTSNFMLRLLSLTGLPTGSDPGSVSKIGTAVIYADVVHWIENGKTYDMYFTPNYGIAELEMGFLNPDLDEQDYPSGYTDLIVYRVDVEFTRPDGNNVPGITIPKPFSLSVYARLTTGLTLFMPFPVIRSLEKQNKPLNELYYNGEIQLSCICKFYARDPSGNEVKPEIAAITVMCADYEDPASDDEV